MAKDLDSAELLKDRWGLRPSTPPGTGGPGPFSKVHVIGAGLAGLSAALCLVDAGAKVIVHESANNAGGRCRSYFDKALNQRIDNGNHLLLSGNQAAFAYLDRIQARDTMAGPAAPIFPFIDRATSERWTLKLSPGRIPWWMFRPSQRVPGTGLREYLGLLRLPGAGAEMTVADAVSTGALFHRLIEPLAIASLNTAPAEGSAALFAAIVKQTLMRGGRFCIPRFPRDGLSESLIDPAVAALQAAQVEFRFGHRITGLQIEKDQATALQVVGGGEALGREDAVVLAVPAPVAAILLPGLVVPDAFCAILNVHFQLDADPGEAGFIGIIGGVAEWIFVRPGIVSVTISAADRHADSLADQSADAIAAAVWPDVVAACGLSASRAMPQWRVIKEKRATFAATPAQERRRPQSRTAFNNVTLAGDWTATGLPATIEGAIRSGCSAARALLEREYHA